MLIGIGGISNAGKSSLALKIKNHFANSVVSVLCQDDFAFPNNKIPMIKNHIDWECPESIDFVHYNNAITDAIKNSDIVIAEGIFAFNNTDINKLYNKKLFLTLDRRFFFMRKNTDLRWGKEPDWYIEHIWNSHIKYCKQNIIDDVLTVKTGKQIDFNNIIDFLQFDS